MLEFHKRHYLVTKVEEATTDSRQLFQLVGTLLGHKEENPLPEANSDSVQAEEFAGFFHDKIDNIRSRFSTTVPYKPVYANISQTARKKQLIVCHQKHVH